RSIVMRGSFQSPNYSLVNQRGGAPTQSQREKEEQSEREREKKRKRKREKKRKRGRERERERVEERESGRDPCWDISQVKDKQDVTLHKIHQREKPCHGVYT